MKREMMKNMRADIRKSTFQLRVMKVLNSRDDYDIGFIHNSEDLQARMSTGEILTINFNPSVYLLLLFSQGGEF